MNPKTKHKINKFLTTIKTKLVEFNTKLKTFLSKPIVKELAVNLLFIFGAGLIMNIILRGFFGIHITLLRVLSLGLFAYLVRFELPTWIKSFRSNKA